MGVFGGGSKNHGSSDALEIRKSLLLKKCGDTATDVAIEQFNHLQESTSRVMESVQEYIKSMRHICMESSNLAQSLNGFYAGSTEMNTALRRYQEVHVEADVDIPEHLIAAAKNIILEPLEDYLNRIRAVRQQVLDFYATMQHFKHYEAKVEKLEKAKSGRSKKGKEETGSQKDKMLRNNSKLDDARNTFLRKRQQTIATISEMQQKRVEVMDPIFRKINMMQEEYHKQSFEALRKFGRDGLDSVSRFKQAPKAAPMTALETGARSLTLEDASPRIAQLEDDTASTVEDVDLQ